MRMGTKIIMGVALVALLLIAGRLFLSEASFSPANPSWDGVSAVMQGIVRPLYGFGGLADAGAGDTLLIVGPSAGYPAEDVAYVRAFLERGGRLAVMDDFGTAGGLLHDIGSPITILQTPLCQDMDYYKKPAFPVVREIGGSSLTANVSELVFNHPAPLQVEGDAEVLARTTVMGWLDPNGNGVIDGAEQFGSYPLVARADYGSGELFVAGDADLAINSMQGLGDNRALLSNLPGAGTVYLDVAHGQQVPPLAGLYYTIKYNIIAQILIVLLTFGLGLAYLARGRIFGKREVAGQEPERDTKDARSALIAGMKERLPLSDREIEEIDRKL
ncbi:MAG: hypothetical protein A4E28_02345 [Methanocella sp. PtaU1.Bin125]|nr:MAG: hypothetical protein A4E28_02345 [Methanocella sp. PtaU1.Bin125]